MYVIRFIRKNGQKDFETYNEWQNARDRCWWLEHHEGATNITMDKVGGKEDGIL